MAASAAPAARHQHLPRSGSGALAEWPKRAPCSVRGHRRRYINQIYNHLFIESHQLDAGMMRFDANPRIARAWERLQNGNPHPSDFDLLAHELYESNWMRQHGDQNYRRAHQATLDAGHTWDEHAPAADGIGFR